MNHLSRAPIAVIVFVGVAGCLTGCSERARNARQLAQAQRYQTKGDYARAEIEYINVLRRDSLNPAAIASLGQIYFEQGRTTRVFAYLSKARELQPTNVAVRNALGRIYLNTGNPKEARQEALFVLKTQPENDQALTLLAESAVTAAEINEARARLQATGKANRATVAAAEGILLVREAKFPQAEALFERARLLDPKCITSYLGLATVYRSRKDLPRAEEAFGAAAKLSPVRSPAHIQYAQFEADIGHPDVAERELQAIIKAAPDSVPPYVLLAKLDAAARRYDKCLAQLAKVESLDPGNGEALLLSARARLGQGDAPGAVADLERAAALYPRSSAVRFQLGLAYVANSDAGKAMGSFAEALRLTPDFPSASLALAELNLRQGNPNAAIGLLNETIKRHPNAKEPWIALAQAHTRAGNLDQALSIYRELVKAFPRDPQLHLQTGFVLLQQENRADAQKAFETALTIGPTFLPALEQLVALDVREKKYAEARLRVETVLKADPKSAAAQLLLAQVALAAGEIEPAQAALQKSIELQPDTPAGYLLLAQAYMAGDHADQAVETLKQSATRDQKNPAPLMLMGLIRQQQGRFADARDCYEKVLALNPRYGPVLNNLAYLYSQQFGDLEKAVTLGRQAREVMPSDPHTADTLGWILFRRREYPYALTLLSESAEALASSPEVNFHLGMTLYMLGEEQSARVALKRALALDPAFNGADTAGKALRTLDIAPSAADENMVEKLQQTAALANDPVAFTRLGAIYELRGDPTRAQTAYENALRASSSNVGAALKLIRLYQQGHQTAKALELAKTTRKLAPADPDVAFALAQVAFDSGDFGWAASLLSEVANVRPADPDVQLALARSAYNVGQLSAATEALHRVVESASDDERARTAKNLLQLMDLGSDGQKAAEALPWITESLVADPKNVAALMALGMAQQYKADDSRAIQSYRTVLKELPDFAPAQRCLAILLSRATTLEGDSAVVAIKARQAYPSDPDVAKALGMIACRQGDFKRAAPLLEESARTRTEDPEVLYYLGLAQLRLDRRDAATKAFRQALDLKPDRELALKTSSALESLVTKRSGRE